MISRQIAATCSFLSGPGLALVRLVDDLGHAVGPEERGALGALDLAHLLGHAGALVEQFSSCCVQASICTRRRPGRLA
jgi:hypothetical protein